MLCCSGVLGLDEHLHAGRAPFVTKRSDHSRIATSSCWADFCRRRASSACAPLAGSRRTDADIALGLLHQLAHRRGGQFKVNRDLASRPAARCIQPHELDPEHRRQTIGRRGFILCSARSRSHQGEPLAMNVCQSGRYLLRSAGDPVASPTRSAFGGAASSSARGPLVRRSPHRN
jgi:hypothetical protein